MSRDYISKKKKLLVRQRAFFCCEYCQSLEDFSPQTFSMEHIIPINLNGNSTLDNLALSCQTCNNHKYNKIEVLDNETQQLIPLFNPRKDNWTDHFQWNENFTLVLSLTGIGKVTIKTLNLNRPNLLNFRFAVALAGEHPPIHTI